MKIRKRKNIHICNNIDEVVEILNFSYKTLQFKDINWYNSNKNSIGTVKVPFVFTDTMKKYLGKTIKNFRAVKVCRDIQVFIQEEGFKGFYYSLQMFEEFEDFIIEKR